MKKLIFIIVIVFFLGVCVWYMTKGDHLAAVMAASIVVFLFNEKAMNTEINELRETVMRMVRF